MSEWRRLLGSERGVALPLAMILLLVLTMLTITFMSLGAVEPQISRNLSDGARARQLAESGLEYGLGRLLGQNFSDLLSSATTGGYCGSGVVCRVLASSQALPGLTSTQGTFTVTMRNDYLPSDNLLTGVAIESCSTEDVTGSCGSGNLGNGIVVLSATGTFNGASRTVTAVVQRGTLNINAGLTLPGLQSDAFTNTPCPSGNCPPGTMYDYSIDGRDWKQSDVNNPTGDPTQTKWGIAVQPGVQQNKAPTTYEQNTEAGFSDSYRRGYVQGKDQGEGYSEGAGKGRNTIAPDTGLNPSLLQSFLNNVAANPSTQILPSTQACAFAASGGAHTKPEGLKMTAVGNTGQVNVRNNCNGSQGIDMNLSLGSPTAPVMMYVKGEYDPSSNFIGVAADGNDTMEGFGILIVEDADMSFFGGNFRWNGIVIVTGQNVGVGFRSGSSSEIRGALIANETNGAEAGGYFEFLNQANAMRIRRSKENIDMALNGLYNMRTTTYREN